MNRNIFIKAHTTQTKKLESLLYYLFESAKIFNVCILSFRSPNVMTTENILLEVCPGCLLEVGEVLFHELLLVHRDDVHRHNLQDI